MSCMCVFVAVTSIFVLAQAQSLSDGSITAGGLLNAYNRSVIDARENIAFDVEETSQRMDGLAQSQVTSLKRTTLRSGNQVSVTVGPGSPKSTALDNSLDRLLFTDAEQFSYSLQIGKAPDLLMMGSDKEPLEDRIRFNMGMWMHLEGAGWNRKAIVDTMRESPSLRLRDHAEVVGGHQTYVIEAQNEQDTILLWIDPEYGFNPRKIEMYRGQAGEPPSSNSLRHLVIDHIGIEEVNGKYLVMSADMAYTGENPDTAGEKFSYHFTVKRTNVRFNPDLSEASKEFWEGVPDGTPVQYTDERGIRGVKYEWYKGKVRTKVDDVFVRDLDKSIEAAKADISVQVTSTDASSSEQPRTVTSNSVPGGPRDNNKTHESYPWLKPLAWSMSSLVGLCVVGVGLWTFARKRRGAK